MLVVWWCPGELQWAVRQEVQYNEHIAVAGDGGAVYVATSLAFPDVIRKWELSVDWRPRGPVNFEPAGIRGFYLALLLFVHKKSYEKEAGYPSHFITNLTYIPKTRAFLFIPYEFRAFPTVRIRSSESVYWAFRDLGNSALTKHLCSSFARLSVDPTSGCVISDGSYPWLFPPSSHIFCLAYPPSPRIWHELHVCHHRKWDWFGWIHMTQWKLTLFQRSGTSKGKEVAQLIIEHKSQRSVLAVHTISSCSYLVISW